MNLKTQLDTLKQQRSDLPVERRVELSCRLAKQSEKAGDYEAAAEALEEFWPNHSAPPDLHDLDEPAKAKLLLRIGAVAGLLGSAQQTAGSQETAKDLITKAIEIFEKLGKTEEAAEARSDLALCYWREGSLDEARINLTDALTSLKDKESDLKAVVLIRAGMVEVDRDRLDRALSLYNEAGPLVERSEDHALKGSLHIELGILLRRLATPANREDYLDRALLEYAAASFHFEQVGNYRYVALVENNLGYLYFTNGQYKDAHEHLDRARHLFHELKDIGTAAQVDETRARTLLAQGHIREAERVVRSAVRVLERGGQQAVLADALATHGVAFARLGNDTRARTVFERAVTVAETAGDLESAGRVKLSIIEELGAKQSIKELVPTYHSAVELLKRSQDPSTGKRLISCAAKLLDMVNRLEPEPEIPATWEGFSLRQHLRDDEKSVIERALRDARGSVTKAARLLGFKHHQSLISLLNTRHKELLKARSPARRRRRRLFSAPNRMTTETTKASARPNASQISVLHVEDNKEVAHVIADILGAEGMEVKTCRHGMTALKWLAGDARYDVVIVDNDLPGLGGLELARRVRKITHRRKTPIIMLSGDEIETEAWRAGVKEFLRKPEDIERVASTVARLSRRKEKSD
jgi:CheY-like chemotaxis protein/tetratricopeptide (TPR) repeat protein